VVTPSQESRTPVPSRPASPSPTPPGGFALAGASAQSPVENLGLAGVQSPVENLGLARPQSGTATPAEPFRVAGQTPPKAVPARVPRATAQAQHLQPCEPSGEEARAMFRRRFQNTIRPWDFLVIGKFLDMAVAITNSIDIAKAVQDATAPPAPPVQRPVVRSDAIKYPESTLQRAMAGGTQEDESFPTRDRTNLARFFRLCDAFGTYIQAEDHTPAITADMRSAARETLGITAATDLDRIERLLLIGSMRRCMERGHGQQLAAK